MQAKAATPDVTAVITVLILLRGGLDSSPTDSVDSEVSVWKRGRMRYEALHLVMNKINIDDFQN